MGAGGGGPRPTRRCLLDDAGGTLPLSSMNGGGTSSGRSSGSSSVDNRGDRAGCGTRVSGLLGPGAGVGSRSAFQLALQQPTPPPLGSFQNLTDTGSGVTSSGLMDGAHVDVTQHRRGVTSSSHYQSSTSRVRSTDDGDGDISERRERGRGERDGAEEGIRERSGREAHDSARIDDVRRGVQRDVVQALMGGGKSSTMSSLLNGRGGGGGGGSGGRGRERGGERGSETGREGGNGGGRDAHHNNSTHRSSGSSGGSGSSANALGGLAAAGRRERTVDDAIADHFDDCVLDADDAAGTNERRMLYTYPAICSIMIECCGTPAF